jgi:HAD superfamily hydrolase (TIGR01450 family)
MTDGCLDQYSVFLLDVDGVLLRGEEVVAGACSAFRALQSRGQTLVLTNNATRSRAALATWLSERGFAISPEQVLCSAYAAAIELCTRHGRQPVWPLGEHGLIEELSLAGHTMASSPDEAAWVVAGMDRQLTYAKLADALKALNGGAHLLATNTDATFPTARGPMPGAGAVIGALRGMGFEPDLTIGKPERTLFRRALHIAQAPEDQVLMIGDRLQTDILGAQRSGIDSLLVLSGISDRQAVQDTGIVPTWIASSLGSILAGSVEPGCTALLPQDRTPGT